MVKNSNNKNLKINESKTQLLSVSSASYDTRAAIKTESDELTSGETLKMLGFVFSEKPSIQAQLEYLTRKANKRYFVLLHYKRAGVKKERLRDIYCSILRSIVEYSSNAYHPQLNNYQSNALENLQKRALRAIYGYDKSYPELLNDSGLLRLSSRREAAFSKFTAKTVKKTKIRTLVPPQAVLKTHENG